MRLIKSQAKATKSYLKAAEGLVIKAIETGNYKNLNRDLEILLGRMPKESLKLVAELASYEKEYTSKKLKKYKQDVAIPSDKAALKRVVNTSVAVALNSPKNTIEDTYKIFVDKKRVQLMQIVSDSKVLKEEKEITLTKVNNITNGLFTTQNLALAGISIIATANIVRAMLSDKVMWVIDLELNNCSFCEERDGQIFEAGEVDGDIPAHANCGCTLVPVDEDGNEI